MAHSTPTHASGFHLVTVAMTGHAEDKGSTTVAHNSLKRCCLNAVNESRSKKMGLYRDDKWGVACLTEWSRGIVLQLDTHEYPQEQNLPGRTHQYYNQYMAICNNMMHA